MRIREEASYKVISDGVYTVLFDHDPEAIIVGLRRVIDAAKGAGYDNLSIEWECGDNAYPALWGDREETNQERTARLKAEERIAKQKE